MVDRVSEPVAFYLYDRPAKKFTKLFTTRPELEGKTLASMHPIEIKARDGLTLVAYLSLPPGTDKDGNGRPDKPLPMVLNVHGGPWARDDFGYHSEYQWLANRGYAVLAVNYRGSSGFGKNFMNAATMRVRRQDARRPDRRGELGGEGKRDDARQASRSMADRTAVTRRSPASRSRPTCSRAASTSSGRRT